MGRGNFRKNAVLAGLLTAAQAAAIPFGNSSPTTPPATPGGSSSTTAVVSTTQATLNAIIAKLTDTTLNRVDESLMTPVNITSLAIYKNILTSDQTNKKFILPENAVWSDYTEQTGAWNNVLVTGSGTNNTRTMLANTGYSTAMLFQGSATRNRIAFRNIQYSNTTLTSGNGEVQSSLVWVDELPTINGLEISYCSFTCPNAYMNALGWVGYSTSSQSGASSRDIWIHHNEFKNIGRCGIEFLSQGYDGVKRLKNVCIESNTFANCGLKGRKGSDDNYGMFISVSGLFDQVSYLNNSGTEAQRICYEMVNVTNGCCFNNSATSLGNDPTVFYGFSDDQKGFTADIVVVGGSCTVNGRPFYSYECKRIGIDAQNGLWKGYQGVDMGSNDGLFMTRLNILTRHKELATGFQMGNGNTNCTLRDSVLSTAGAYAELQPNGTDHYLPANESFVLRAVSTNNHFENVHTILGKGANGDTLKGASNTQGGGDGSMVNLAGSTNTFTNCTFEIQA